MTDQLPDGAEFVSVTPSQGSCNPTSRDVACDLGDLATGGTASVNVVVRLTRPGTAVNVAYVTSRMLDEYSDNNQAQATTEVAGSDGGGVPGPIGPVGPPRLRPVNDGYMF